MKKMTLFFSILLLSSSFCMASFPVKRTFNSSVIEKVENLNSESSNELILVSNVQGDNQVVALVLCWLLGILGAHRFYLGDIWQGVVQLLTLGGLGIWVLIDFIRIITGDLGPGW